MKTVGITDGRITMIFFFGAEVCLNCLIKSYSLPNLENTFPYISSKILSSNLLPSRELSAVSAGVGAGLSILHTCCQVTPPAASRAPISTHPTPRDSLLSCPSARGEPTAFRSHLKNNTSPAQSKQKASESSGASMAPLQPAPAWDSVRE